MVHQEGTGARCPRCQTPSNTLHSRYIRRPADLPCAGRAVKLELRVRRFRCQNAQCPRRTFADRLPRLLPSRARRTRRLASAQCSVALTAGAAEVPRHSAHSHRLAAALALHGLSQPVRQPDRCGTSATGRPSNRGPELAVGERNGRRGKTRPLTGGPRTLQEVRLTETGLDRVGALSLNAPSGGFDPAAEQPGPPS